ncbi:MAG: hypothetical protein V7603_51 [Micromonosporaceae bacterium]
MGRSWVGGGLVVALALTGGLLRAAPAQAAAAKPESFANCTLLQARYKHGVGRPGARDRVRGSTKPVTTFKVDRKLYYANIRLDRDGDGVACEKR